MLETNLMMTLLINFKKIKISILLTLFCLCSNAGFSQQSKSFFLDGNIEVRSNEPEGFPSFLSNFLKDDIQKVFGPASSKGTSNQIILRVVNEKSSVISPEMIQKIDEPLDGKWEVFSYKNHQKNGIKYLIITGSDNRGLAFGAFNLSEQLGVSPWHFWADVPIKKRNSPFAVNDTTSNPPSVKYRGIFLNDEDWGLQPWAAKTFEEETNDIGPKTYAKIFELLLRLKANMIWPAMHPSTKAFYHYPENKLVAQRYNIIIGTTHAEPLMRNNVDEWQENTMGKYNYLTNKDNVLQYWSDRLYEAKPYENLYSMGMRGKHDSGMQGVKSKQEAVELTSRIIKDQRELLANILEKPYRDIPQVITLYKEVLELYKIGLEVPEDITLIWPDDNYGYIKSLNNEAERKRSGGSGVYYHASYWGRPHDYLWIGTTDPALMRFEMQKAYEMGADKIWVVNVGDIKPIEYPTQLFLDMAYNIKPFLKNESVFNHLENWTSYNLGSKEAAKLLWKNYELAFVRKPEFMGWSKIEPITPTHPTTLTSAEIDQRLNEFEVLEKQTLDQRPTDKTFESPYFQLVLYPILAAGKMNQKFLNLDKYYTFAPENRTDKNEYFQEAIQAYEDIKELTDQYNQEISNGKWNHMMSMNPRNLPVYKSPMDLKNVEQKIKLTSVEPILTIPAGQYTSIKKTDSSYWEKIAEPSFSHNAIVSKPFTSKPTTNSDSSSVVEYDFEIASSGLFEIKIQAIPLHPLHLGAGQSVAIQIDDKPYQTIDFEPQDRSEEWKENVLTNKTIKSLQPLQLENGRHTIKLKMIDAGVLVDYILIYSK